MPSPALVATGDASRRYASWFSRVLAWGGMLIFAALALLSAGWTALFLVVVVLSVQVHLRTRRRRWELDQPGPEARFRFGPRAVRSARLADIAGVVVVPYPGASSRGIPVTRDHERWWLVDEAGSAIEQASTEGLDPALVERFRETLDVPFVHVALAKRLGALPAAMPWWTHRPQLTIAVAIVVSICVMIAVLAVPLYWA